MGNPGLPVVIGLDLGTTSAKAVAYDTDGQRWAEVDHEYPLHSPWAGAAEQDPDQVRAAAFTVLREATEQATSAGARIVGVCLSSAMHSILALDQQGRPRSPAITFADTRATPQVRRLKEDGIGLAIYRRTGTPLHPMSPLAKLRWFADEQPETTAAAHRWVSLKEYVSASLIGDWLVDHSIASASGLFSLEARDWDDEALDFARISRDQLSQLVPTTEVRPLLAEATQRTGLPEDTPLILGAADGCLANLGAGAITPDIAAVTVATSGAARVTTDRIATDPDGRLFCYALSEDRWVLGGATSNGGLVLKWLRDGLLADLALRAEAEGQDPYDAIVGLAEQVPPGSDGLLFLPYLVGERAPRWDATPRGVLFGLDLRHGQGHVVRAAMEGALLQLRWVLQAMEDNGIRPAAIRASGGATHSDTWLQLMADVLGRPMAVPTHGEATCLGAALLGAVALDLVPSLDEAAKTVSIARTVEPDGEASAAYPPVFERFLSLYDALEEPFAALATRHEGAARR